MAYTYLLNALDANRWRIVQPTTYMADVSMERSAVKVPGRPGEIPAGSTPAPRPLILRLFPARELGLDRLMDDLSTLLTMPSLTVTRVTPEGSRTAEAVLEGHSWDGRSVPSVHAPVIVNLSLPGVWWRDPSTIDVSLEAGAQSILPVGVPPTERVGSAPITDAVMRFDLGASAPSITDVLTGTGVSVDNNATSTQYTYIDAGQLHAWVSTSASAWSAPSSGRLDHLVSYPGPGPLSITPQIRLGATGTADERWAARARVADVVASHAVVLRYRRSWW